MQKSLHVHFLPSLTSPEQLRGATVIVIDVLRATTTITQALVAGAREVIPCLELEDVRSRGSEMNREEILLGGERGGEKIDLFDLGNSPSEYTEEIVQDKSVLFTTTNGTRALESCREAYQVLIGSALNIAALVEAVCDTMNVHIVCAGTEGQVTREDILVAGAIAYNLTRNREKPPALNDSATVARAAWRNVVAGAIAKGEPLPDVLAREFRDTFGGENLLSLGFEADLVDAAQVDRVQVVPQLDVESWRIFLP